MDLSIDHREDVLVNHRYQARLYQESDRQSLLELSALHYGDRELGTAEYVDWLITGSPAGKGLCFVSEDTRTGKVVGFAFHVPVHVKAGRLRGIGRVGCNAVVHPSLRRMGIYSSIARLGNESYQGVLFSYGFPKPLAVMAHGKAGRIPVAHLPLLVRPLDIQALTRVRIGKPILRRTVNLGWSILASTLFCPRKVDPERTAIRISALSHFDHKFDEFWERVAGKYEIVVERTSRFLNWRFIGQRFRSYKILAAWDGVELVGYIVTRHLDLERVKSGLIMDFIVEPGKRGEQAGLLLIEEATHRFQQEGMVLTGCLMLPHTHEYRILKKAGFLPAPRRLAPQQFMLMTASWSPETPLDYLLRADRWFVTMANHDAI